MTFPKSPLHASTRRGLTGTFNLPTMRSNTPAMPLNDAHFGGFFASGVCR